MVEPLWLRELLLDEENGHLLDYLGDPPSGVFVLADRECFAFIAAQVAVRGLPGVRLAQSHHFPVRLAANFDIQTVVVISASDEEAERQRVLESVEDAGFPPAVLRGLEVLTFLADIIPARWAKGRPEPLSRRATPSALPILYAIVNAPRAGSTYLSDLLASLGLGRPSEHIRGWLVRLITARPPQLFDLPRLITNLVVLDQNNGVFGTKIISHWIFDLEPLLTPPERSFLRFLIAQTRIIYLHRPDKLDQALSTYVARHTGVWHQRGTPGVRGDAAPLPDDPDVIAVLQAAALQQDEMLVSRLVDLDVTTIGYDDLVADPALVCNKVAEALGRPVTTLPTSNLVKLADDSVQALRARFVASGRDAVCVSGESLIEAARRARQAQQRDDAATVERIRAGHARSRHGDYQDRHYYLVDYDHQSEPGIDFMFRGPKPADLARGAYIAYVGASQTLGAFVDRPFAKQVSDSLGLDMLNLGRGGAGPEFFLRGGPVERWLGDARAVVVQVMAARMVSNDRMESLEGRATVRYQTRNGETRQSDCDSAWSLFFNEGEPEATAALIAQSRQRWVEATRAISELARGPTILLWFSDRPPAYTPADGSKEAVLGGFPQLVDQTMIDAVRPAFSAYVEAIAPQTEEPTRSAFSGEVLPVIFGGGDPESQTLDTVNRYYPTQAMHDHAAARLAEAVQELLK